MKKFILAVFTLLSFTHLSAQVKTLKLDEYLALVKSHHPVAFQASLNKQKAFYTRRQALGAFDPKLELNQGQKIFNGKTYYEYWIPELKLPLWYGVDLKASYTSYSGDYVNPENKVPKAGLGYLGFSVPLGKGLLIDDRRAAVKQAAIFRESADNEQMTMINNLFVEATDAYTDWLKAWLNIRIYQRAVVLANERLQGTKLLFQNGDRPAIDTLEAEILLQSRQQKLADYQTDLKNAKNNLSTFLWTENFIPTNPDSIHANPEEGLLLQNLPNRLLTLKPSDVAAANPEVKNYHLKITGLQIEKRLKLEALKPELTVNLGLLNSGKNVFANLSPDWLENNNKIGLTFSMPLTFTKERAAYSLAKIKIQEAEYALADKTNLTATKWENYKNDLANLDTQIKIYQKTVTNAKELLAGEETKFKFGESSLFLINAREQKLLELQEKLNEVSTKRIDVIQKLRLIANAIGV